MSVEYEGALLVTLVVGCNVFTEAFFESSASLSEVGFLTALLAAWDLVDDAVLRGVSWSGCLDRDICVNHLVSPHLPTPYSRICCTKI